MKIVLIGLLLILNNGKSEDILEVPTKIENFEVINETASSLLLSWRISDDLASKVEFYYVFYVDPAQISNSVRVYENGTNVKYNLTGLEPAKNYSLYVTPFSYEGIGIQSPIIHHFTEIPPPDFLEIVSISVDGANVTLNLSSPIHYGKFVDTFEIYMKNGKIWEIVGFATNINGSAKVTILVPTTVESEYYNILVRPGIESIIHENKTIYGNKLKFMVKLLPCCDIKKVQRFPDNLFKIYYNWVFIGFVSIIMAFIVIALGICTCRFHEVIKCRIKCFKDDCKTYFGCKYNNIGKQEETYRQDDCENESRENWIHASYGKESIALENFSDHVDRFHKDTDSLFSKEFESIQKMMEDLTLTASVSELPEHRPLNRYLNVLAFDHSRVKINVKGNSSSPTDLEERYINANYIDGFQKKNAYIGTQGPVPESFETFWLMIWQENVSVIVMVTNFIERGRKKCDIYWPKEGKEKYGCIEVELLSEDKMASYVVRKLKIINNELKVLKSNTVEKIVSHFQFTAWLDHRTPLSCKCVLNFISKTAAASPPDAGPIVVHCSAGVGRTGCYVVLHSMLLQMETTKELNVFNYLWHVRKQRNFLVQTEEQYVFIHDALLEHLQVGWTNISKSNWSAYMHKLQHGDDEGKKDDNGDEIKHWKLLEKQFILVKAPPRDRKDEFVPNAARALYNSEKNRTMEILPTDYSRVFLTPVAGEDGSDYINASFLEGFYSDREYIITQHPLISTIFDFWSMVFDIGVNIIVLLSPSGMQYVGTYFQDFPTFWPTKDCMETNRFRVKFFTQEEQDGFSILELRIECPTDDDVPIKFLYCPCWPQKEDPYSAISLVKMVYHLQKQEKNNQIVVVDRFGGTEAATFCVLLTLMHTLLYDGCADIYLYAKLYHLFRPGIWQTLDDYWFIHKAINAFICKDLIDNEFPSQDELLHHQANSPNSLQPASVEVHFSDSGHVSNCPGDEDEDQCIGDNGCASKIACAKKLPCVNGNSIPRKSRIDSVHIDLDAIEEVDSSCESEA